MDFALISTLMPLLAAGISRVLISYNIGCQWQKNLQDRFNSYAVPAPKISNLKCWRVLVPKFHLSGHGPSCQILFNLGYMKWAGRTDGKRIEASWAQTTSMATWTQECGPNTHQNILNNHWNAANWRKLTGLGEHLTFSDVSLCSFVLLDVCGIQ